MVLLSSSTRNTDVPEPAVAAEEIDVGTLVGAIQAHRAGHAAERPGQEQESNILKMRTTNRIVMSDTINRRQPRPGLLGFFGFVAFAESPGRRGSGGGI